MSLLFYFLEMNDLRNVMQKSKLNIGWIIVILLSVMPVVFWFFTPSVNSSFNTTQNIIISLGEMFGMVGIVMFSFNFILAARLPFVEKLFGGLNRVYKKHNFLGQLALILLLFHPLFLLPKYSSSFLEAVNFLFLSDLWARNFGIIALWLMIFLIILTLYLRPKYNIWKITHKFFGLALFFGALHAYLIPGYIMNNLFLKSYILIFPILGILSFLYKSIFGKYLIKGYEYVVEDINHLNDEIAEIILKPKNKKIQFNAGQFIFISFKQEDLSESHPFSISSQPNEEQLRITVKKLGDFTKNLINKLQKGVIARVEGPYGVFSYKDASSRNQVWIAGGIGITPFVSFAKDMIQKKIKNINVTLFYCVKNEKEAVYLDFFKDAASCFFIIPFFSSERGYINTKYIKKYSENFRESDFFICAPLKMIEELNNHLIVNEGINKNKIHSEGFNF
jgi:predicted ferric reductase